jgi:hypothetical protein
MASQVKTSLFTHKEAFSAPPVPPGVGSQMNANAALMARSKFAVGQAVKFRGRRGVEVEGTIISFGPKNVKVRASKPSPFVGSWTVSAGLLTPA